MPRDSFQDSGIGVDLWNAFAVALLLVLNYLQQNSYSLYRPEAVALLAVVFLPMAILLLIFRRLDAAWCFYAFLTAGLTDLLGGVAEKLRGLTDTSLGSGPWIGMATLAVLFIVYCIIIRATRKSIRQIFLWGITAALLSGIVFQYLFPVKLFASSGDQTAAAATGSKPNVYFFILDEHIGLAGMGKVSPEARRLGTDLENTYREKDFLVYPRAYSNFNATLDSIPSLLNAKIFAVRREALANKSLKVNRLFEKFKREGYRLNIYQSTHLDYGHSRDAAADKLFTYQESSAGYVQTLPIGFRGRFWVLLNNFVENHQSVALKKIFRNFHRLKARGSFMTGVVAVDRLLEEVEADTLKNKSGVFFFIHLLMPHASYIFGKDRRVLKPWEWEASNDAPLDSQGTLNTPEDRNRKYSLYGGQVRCLHQKLDSFFNFLKEQGIYESSAIVLCSDHGSRLNKTDLRSKYLDRLTTEDYRDGFNSFVAVKGGNFNGSFVPNEARRADERFSSVKILAGFFGTLSEEALQDPALDRLYLQTDRFSVMKEIPVPDDL